MAILLPLFLLLTATQSSSGQPSSSSKEASLYCGVDTFLDATISNKCICSTIDPISEGVDASIIRLAGLMDTTSYGWCPDIFEFTVEQINQGRWAALADPASMTVEYSLRNSRCDESTAVREYWDLRKGNGNRPLDGVIGARCSGASTSLAHICGLEDVPHVSPASNSAKLTSSNFPFFSRMVAPNDERGEVGAIITLLRSFKWNRVTILATDTQFARDFVTEFRKLWVGTHQDAGGNWVGSVAYFDSIPITTDNKVDQDSVTQALEEVPTSDPTINSRIIVLVAHNQHAFEVLETAYLSNFQPDTIWVGPSAWVGREPPRSYTLPARPGYLGVAPFRNRNDDYTRFMVDYRAWLEARNKTDLEELPTFAAETVDAIVAMTKAISLAPGIRGRNGAAIVQVLRQLDFGGVSGRVQFTSEGDRKDPQYTFLNSHSVTSDGAIGWTDVGFLGTEGIVTRKSGEVICFAEVGCNPVETPGDSYPVPPHRLPLYAIVVIAVLLVLFFYLAFRYWRSHRKKKNMKVQLDAFRNSFVSMKAAERDHVPTIVPTIVPTKGVFVRDIESGVRSIKATQWCWKETERLMKHHDSSEIYGDPAECWIKYTADSNTKLEEAFQAGDAEVSPLPGYAVNFAAMEQIQLITQFKREVRRVIEAADVQAGVPLPPGLLGEPQTIDSGTEQPLLTSFGVRSIKATQWCWKESERMMNQHDSSEIYGDPAECWIKYTADCNTKLEEAFQAGDAEVSPLPGYAVKFGAMEQIKLITQFKREVRRVIEAADVQPGKPLPPGLLGEPQMVLVEGDVVQISKERDDGWAFGTKLHHADEAAAREMVVIANSAGQDGRVIVDEPSVFCDTGWFPLDCTRTPSAEDLEAFKKSVGNSGALDPPAHWDTNNDPKIAKRYVLGEGDKEREAVIKAFKSTLRQPMYNKKVRVLKVERIQNIAMWQSYNVKRQTICYRETSETTGDEALRRFERSWLWHGTNVGVLDKILQQGFNRSFCGKNATMYGKGVYFARDAAYSAYPMYAEADNNGHQYIMACRVVIGEYCAGRKDALTPDIRDPKSHLLYDTTVGLLGNDTMSTPSIFVTYHDAQAYPEYLITFKAT